MVSLLLRAHHTSHVILNQPPPTSFRSPLSAISIQSRYPTRTFLFYALLKYLQGRDQVTRWKLFYPASQTAFLMAFDKMNFQTARHLVLQVAAIATRVTTPTPVGMLVIQQFSVLRSSPFLNPIQARPSVFFLLHLVPHLSRSTATAKFDRFIVAPRSAKQCSISDNGNFERIVAGSKESITSWF